MRGQDAIIAMRQRGKKPALVFLDLLRDHAPMPAWRDWPEVSPAIPTVWVQDDDTPERLDLRFVIGLSVVISGRDAGRVESLKQAAIDAGAQRVIAATLTLDESGQEHRVVSITDTAGPVNLTPEEPIHGVRATA